MSTLAGVGEKQDVLFGLSDPKGSLRTVLPWLLFAAALYSVTHFTVEWFFRAYPHWKSIEDLLKELKTSFEKRTHPLLEICTRLDMQVSQLGQTHATFIGAFESEWHNKPLSGIQDWYTDDFQIRSQSASMELIDHAIALERRDLGDAIEKIRFDICGYEQELSNAKEKFELKVLDYNKTIDKGVARVKLEARIFDQKNSALTATLSEIRSALENTTPIPSSLKVGISSNRIATLLKVWLLGLLPPWVLFFTAIGFAAWPRLSAWGHGLVQIHG